MSKTFTKEQEAEIARIAHEVIQMHIDHDAPDGHKGFEKLEPLLRGKNAKARNRGLLRGKQDE